ncbi:MAG TPA: hypothetical protein VNI79_03775 [Sphingomicrobium sp.]|nr:hypothetical protein [Sphingomicrobium sp.]
MTDLAEGIDWTGTSEDMVREVLAQGEAFLQAQFQSALAADQRATTLASILVTISVAVFAGALAVWESVPDDALYAVSTIAAVLLLAAASAAWAARPIDFWYPGMRPEQWYDGRNEKLVDMLGGASEDVQFRIDENETLMGGNQTAIRISFVLAILSPIIGFIVWRAL